MPVFYMSGAKPEGWAVELVDALIRILDTLHGGDLDHPVDIDHILELKMKYNESRPYKHGKSY
jgi:hypothetical protein